MANPLGLLIGKVPAIYAVSLILVFLTWIFALVVGEDGQVLFNAAFSLMAVELVVPLAVMIVAICLIMNIIMPIVLPFVQFFFEIIIDAADGVSGLFGFTLTLTNPLTSTTWTALVPETYVNQLLAILNAIHDWMATGVIEIPDTNGTNGTNGGDAPYIDPDITPNMLSILKTVLSIMK